MDIPSTCICSYVDIHRQCIAAECRAAIAMVTDILADLGTGQGANPSVQHESSQ